MYLRQSLKKIVESIPPKINKNVCILINGETGTGKEVLARCIYEKLKLPGKFVAVDCSNLPDTIFESELFGHKKGAFTDAKEDKKGLVEEADGGVLFIDEIGNLPLGIQAKLLRFLETRKFRRLGENFERKSEFLLVCATNKNLLDLIKEGKFREDLYFRINHIHINLKPLREEKEEIMKLIEEFLKEENKKFKFTPSALEFILCYPWKGNIRELRNFCVNISLRFESGKLIDVADFPEYMFEKWCGRNRAGRGKLKDVIKCFERTLIINYLNNGGDIKGLSQELELSERHVRRILKKHGIEFKKFKRNMP